MTKGEANETFGMSIGILPSYKLPKLTVFLHAGIGFEKENNDADLVSQWFINPYIWVPMGGMRMWVGVQIIDDHIGGDKVDGQILWRVPFGFNFYF